jgi:hypothetical protein
MTSGASLVAMMVLDELARTEPASEGLALLTRLVDQKTVKPIVAVEAPWTDNTGDRPPASRSFFCGKSGSARQGLTRTNQAERAAPLQPPIRIG